MDCALDDAHTFAAEALPRMRSAVRDLCWLLARGYAEKAALALVGDRHELDARQRIAVRRASATDAELERRTRTRLSREEAGGRLVLVDGYNVITTVVCAQGGRVVYLGRDGCIRDLAGLRGRFDNRELLDGVEILRITLETLGVAQARWLFDAPVSGSGELAAALRARGMDAEVVSDPDPVLISSGEVCASSDSRVIEGCSGWINLVRWAIEDQIPEARIVDLGG